MKISEYEATCKAAATAQGLDPVTAILTLHGFKPEVLQTGGYTMCVRAYRDQHVEILVNRPGDHDTPEREYMVGEYRRPSYTGPNNVHGEYEEAGFTYVSLEDIPEMCRVYQKPARTADICDTCGDPDCVNPD